MMQHLDRVHFFQIGQRFRKWNRGLIYLQNHHSATATIPTDEPSHTIAGDDAWFGIPAVFHA